MTVYAGEVTRVDGALVYVLAAKVHAAEAVGPMEAPDGLALVERDRVVISELGGQPGRYVVIARLPAAAP